MKHHIIYIVAMLIILALALAWPPESYEQGWLDGYREYQKGYIDIAEVVICTKE